MILKTKYTIPILPLAALCSLFIVCKSPNNKNVPAPTEETIVKSDMEEKSLKSLKQQWFEDLHKSSPLVDWRLIEHNNRYIKYKAKLSAINSGEFYEKDGQVNIDNGSIVGYWTEKGSVNQAGSMINTKFNSADNKLYAISAGGTLWKGDINGLAWEVINQDLRFDGRFLEFTTLPNGTQRIICSINGHPYYSEGGLEWMRSTGLDINTIPVNKNVLSVNNGKDIFFLSKIRYGENIKLMHSDDYGTNFNAVKSFLTSDADNMAIAAVGNRVFAIEQKSISKSRTYEWNFDLKSLVLLQDNSSISFGTSGEGNLKAVKIQNQVYLYAYDGNNTLRRSSDYGAVWNAIGNLPKKPWKEGFFISQKFPNIMIMGEVEAYRSIDGGSSWSKINHWYEYYSNKTTKLHADIMAINEFDTPQGFVITISNHGGLSTSYNSGASFGNIGLSGLNVSQYYDVASYPGNSTIIFGGSQDQGLQRTLDLGEGPAHFEQIISGDYGHLTFTNGDKSLWTVFPGGWISYFQNPLTTQNHEFTAYYELENSQQSIWLPPIIKSPYNHNAVVLAGGSISGSSGSHLVELKLNDLGDIKATQWPFDFSGIDQEISAMAYNKFSSREFYVLTTNGKFYKSTNSAQSFTQKTQGLADAHYLYGNSILASSQNENIIYITGSGYSNAPIYKSEDGGESFVEMSDGLPPTTVFKMTAGENDRFLYAATEAGPYVYIKNNNRWYDLAQGIAPNQAYWDVEYIKNASKVRFATYGRGIWEFDINSLTAVKENTLASNVNIFPNPSEKLIHIDLKDYRTSFRIVNSNGQIVQSFDQPQSGTIKIDISDFINGLYYIIFDDGTKLSSKPFIKL